MKQLLSLFIVLFCFLPGSITTVNGQGLGVNSSGAPPNASAILDASANNKGFLLPRLTTSERDNISSPAEGLLIYNLDT